MIRQGDKEEAARLLGSFSIKREASGPLLERPPSTAATRNSPTFFYPLFTGRFASSPLSVSTLFTRLPSRSRARKKKERKQAY